MFSKLLIIASAVGMASAACPNMCSGHGTCGASEVCTCYDNWGMGGQPGGDCSDRVCPYELAWVDAPNRNGATHQYAECAAKGVCDRESGECECLTGYTGKACARQTCPDDCSGHGTCEFMNELTFGTVFNDYYTGASSSLGLGVGAVRPSTDYSWDSNRARACVCDATWNGINCAERMCPHGNDAMATRADTSDSLVYQTQTINLHSGGDDGMGLNAEYTDFYGQTFALTFTSRINETFTTNPIKIQSTWATSDELANSIDAALVALPNKVISAVSVTVTNNLGPFFKIAVTFDGDSVQGYQNLLEVSTNACGDGCTPQISGLTTLVTAVNTTSSVTESAVADYNSYECGRRGKCDYDTGVCSCFEGFTGQACSTITALV